MYGPINYHIAGVISPVSMEDVFPTQIFQGIEQIPNLRLPHPCNCSLGKAEVNGIRQLF